MSNDTKAALQGLFDKSLSHIRKQGGPSSGGIYNLCVYRTEDGRGCAAAPFIRKYDPKMEAAGWSTMIRRPGMKKKVDPLAVTHEDFVNELQACHDESDRSENASFMGQYEWKMQALAREHGLAYEAPAP